jgi:hypothetical protein
MSIIYSGQTIVNTTIDGSTSSSINAGLQSVLLSAGWTVITSGSSTGIWRLRSGSTPQGMQADLWIRDATGVGTTCILDTTSMTATNYNTSVQTSGDAALASGTGLVYNIIANPFYFYMWSAANPCPTGQSFMFHVPMVPSFLSGLVTDISVSSYGQSTSATVTTAGLFGLNNSNYSHLNGLGRNNGQWEISSLSSFASPNWFDGSSEFYEPRVMSYQTNGTGGQVGSLLAVGYLWDALVVQYAMPRGTAVSYDGNSWTSLTEGLNPGLLILSA